MDVSIIIVNYNTKDLLKQCIESVLAKTHDIEYEIIVVDNASFDGSQQMIKDIFPKITFIESPENLGFGRANNLGFDYAKGRNFFLLNSDTILLNNAVKILSDYLDKDSQVGICGGNLYNEKGDPVLSFVRCFPSIFSELNKLFGCVLFKFLYGKNCNFNHTNKPLKVAYIIGADIMLRASILSTVGRFDPDFFMFYEETELSYRIKKSGLSIFSVPDAHIIHLGSQSFTNNIKKTKLMLDSSNLYYKKTLNIFVRNIVRILFILNIRSRIYWFKLSGNTNKINYYNFIIQNF